MSNLIKTLFIISTSLFLFAAEQLDDNYLTNKQGLQKNNYQTNALQENTAEDIRQQNFNVNYKEVVYEHLKRYQRYEQEQKNSSNIATAINAHNDFLKQENISLNNNNNSLVMTNNLGQANNNFQTSNVSYFLTGYCNTKNEIQIERISQYARLSCDFDKIGHAELFTLFTPDYFSKSLIATPQYIIFNNQRFIIKKGAILNAQATSINIATSVNDYKIAKILASSTIIGSEIATKNAQAYLQAKSDARSESSTNFITDANGNVIQVNNNKTLQPNKNDYLANAGIEFVSGLVGLVGNAIIDNIPYTFKINKGILLYADLELDLNSNNIRGLNIQQNNIINSDEPILNVKEKRITDRDSFKQLNIQNNNEREIK
ncbi:hypothetical protein [Campylobacter canadensis]|uniref:hypothetical protein n=1 Tax=Campylobacter canadensis TaxID=449520 RepID=UPI001CC9A7E3|nr:hypothetical protein [Campylobacter canadensis]MBZ8002380.1 hypothetical protein [Campylobacter canadensis]